MSLVLAEIGYRVRSADNGFSALREIRQEMPDILLTDLNMPGMSGFELLSVVHRRFPAVHKIAMSGAFFGSEVPSGASADAFYQKGTGVNALLHILGTMPEIKQRAPQPSRARLRPGDMRYHLLPGVPEKLSPGPRRLGRPRARNRLHPLQQFDSVRNRPARGPDDCVGELPPRAEEMPQLN
jgi:DNA-binding NarL/FixJ family response regulator